MDDIVAKLIKHIKKNNIKFITINESNHRSYTCHTFHYKLVKALYENKIINTFSSERMGINDGEIINHYLENKLDLDKMVDKLPFGGMGYYRIIKYLSKKPYHSYKIVGLEEDKYCQKVDKPEYARFINIDNKEREDFWLNNIKKIIKERGNLFINGFHLNKNDKIGKYLLKHHKNETLFLGMSALEITTQILIIDDKEKDIDQAVINDRYKMKVERIDKICPPTKLEKTINDYKLLKVTKRNGNQKIRAIGCYLAVYENEYQDKVTITDEVSYKIKNYDYVILIKKSVYKEKMFY